MNKSKELQGVCEDSSITLPELLSNAGFDDDVIKAIKKGYEGVYFDKPVSQSVIDKSDGHYGRDILIKLGMRLKGKYRSWDDRLLMSEPKGKALIASLNKGLKKAGIKISV